MGKKKSKPGARLGRHNKLAGDLLTVAIDLRLTAAGKERADRAAERLQASFSYFARIAIEEKAAAVLGTTAAKLIE